MPSAFRRAVTAALRVPGPWVPGWFPLVVEPVDRRLGPDHGEARVRVLGAEMELTTEEYTQRRFYYHCYEAPEQRFLRRVLRPGDIVVDVGAHVGIVTLAAARLVGPGGRVHAFEPVPPNFDRLSRNVALNGLQNVTLNCAAAGSRTGPVTLGLTDVGVASGTTGGFTVGGEHGQVQSSMVRLDEYLAEREPGRRVRVVKVDAEGHEPEVVAGMTALTGELAPDYLLLEINAELLAHSGSGGAQLLGQLAASGYDLLRLRTGGGLGAAPSAEKLRAAASRSAEATSGPARTLRAGLAQRNGFYGAVAVRRGAR